MLFRSVGITILLRALAVYFSCCIIGTATGTITMMIPFDANDSEPGSRIECITGDKVTVYTKSGATWISKGSFIVPSAGGTVSI